MERQVLIIGGLDISKYIPEKGISFEDNDLDAPSTGRTTQDGLMHRAVVASKVKMQVKCFPLPDSVTEQLFPILKQKFFEVVYLHPGMGISHGIFYSNGRKGVISSMNKNGVVMWDGVSFPLIER